MLSNETRYLRLKQIIGDNKATPPIPPLVPVGRSTWWHWVSIGKAPKPGKLGERVTMWRANDVFAMIEQLQPQENQF